MTDLLLDDQKSFDDVNPFGSDYKMSIAELRAALESNKQQQKEEKITAEINGQEVPFESSSIKRTHDTMSDAAVFNVNISEQKEILSIIRPYGYEDVKVYLDSDLIFTGRVYGLGNTIEDKERKVQPINCFSQTIDLVDSNSEPPYVYKEKTFKQIVTSIIKPWDIKILDTALDTYKFKRVSISPEEKIGAFLGKLAKQIAVLLSSTVDGKLEIKRSSSIGTIAGKLTNENVITPAITMSWDGRQRFSIFNAVSNRPKKNIKETTVDVNIPIRRVMTYSVNEKDKGLKKETSTAWKKNMSIAQSLSIEIPVIGFYNENGKRWKEGDVITIEFDELWLFKGMKFLIQAVEFIDEKDQKMSNLSLVLPETYTDQEIIEPWDEDTIRLSLYDLKDILDGKYK